MRIDSTAVTEIIIAPDTVQQIITAENLRRIFRQRPQKLDFLFCQRYLFAVNLHCILFQINVQICVRKSLSIRRLLRTQATQYRTHAGHHLRCTERLNHIIVRTDIQTHNLIIILSTRRYHNNRHHGFLAQAAANLKAIYFRHHNIQQHNSNFILILQIFIQCLGSVQRNNRFKAFLFGITG